ncbi:MAG TPA: hypothetical protein VK892_18745 [Pyrinomonadaceae bacterium]|nr:hypothetical protein [Pyrinomonadaceae bacterium]
MALNDIEEEIILLKAVNELIDSMVNFEMLDLYGDEQNTNILFETMTHKRFFNIMLVDFLSRTDRRAFIRQTSYLDGLKKISKNPHFDIDNSIASLKKTTYEFNVWLDQEIEVNNIWLPTIDTETTLRLSRKDFIKMCGNISKHNFLRLISVAEDLKKILFKSGVSIKLDEALLALPDFYRWFHDDILHYHSSTIAEFLNNIRWGIYEYLQPEYKLSIVRDKNDSTKYSYTYPKGVTSRLAKDYYWELMNEVRSPPYVRRFQVTNLLKSRY